MRSARAAGRCTNSCAHYCHTWFNQDARCVSRRRVCCGAQCNHGGAVARAHRRSTNGTSNCNRYISRTAVRSHKIYAAFTFRRSFYQALKSFSAFASVNSMIVRVADEEREQALLDREVKSILDSAGDASSSASSLSSSSLSSSASSTAVGDPRAIWANVYFNIPDRDQFGVQKFGISTQVNGVVQGVRFHPIILVSDFVHISHLSIAVLALCLLAHTQTCSGI